MGFINPKLYLAFTKIFGSNASREILMSFLNAMLYTGEPIYALQLNRGDRYYRLRQVIALSIADFEMFPGYSEVISRFDFETVSNLLNWLQEHSV